MPAVRLLVSGVVQGVGYRDWTLRAARELGVAGWVRNLADGRVEIWAEGEAEALSEFRRRTLRGPRHAEVHGVIADPATPTVAATFERRPTASAPEVLTSSSR